MRGAAGLRHSGRDLRSGDEAACEQAFRERREPALVVAHAQILAGWNPLYRRTQAEPQFSGGLNGVRHCVNPSLPALVKYGFAAGEFDRAHVLHPPHVMDAVHGETTTFATPIMASRVTNAASASSLRWAVFAGRSGSTR